MSSITTGDILTSVSILILLVTFVVGYLQKYSSDRRQRTFDFLLAVMEEQGPIHQANLEFAIWIKEDRVFEDDNIEANENKIVIQLIDFYDLISDSAMRGIVDQEMIFIHLGGRMRSAYKVTKKYTEARRKRLNRPALHKPFETFVTERIKDKEV